MQHMAVTEYVNDFVISTRQVMCKICIIPTQECSMRVAELPSHFGNVNQGE